MLLKRVLLTAFPVGVFIFGSKAYRFNVLVIIELSLAVEWFDRNNLPSPTPTHTRAKAVGFGTGTSLLRASVSSSVKMKGLE